MELENEYEVPWSVIEQATDLSLRAKRVLRRVFSEEIYDEGTGDFRREPPEVLDFRRLSERGFLLCPGIGRVALEELKRFLARRGKRLAEEDGKKPRRPQRSVWDEASSSFWDAGADGSANAEAHRLLTGLLLLAQGGKRLEHRLKQLERRLEQWKPGRAGEEP